MESIFSRELSEQYRLPSPVECQLIRRSFNDHYLIQTADQTFVFRMYMNNKHYIKDYTDLLFELDLLTFLYRQDIPVVPPIPNVDGHFLSVMQINRKEYFTVLFPYAKGKPIDLHLSIKQAISLGKVIAQVQEAGELFSSQYSRHHLDAHHLIEEPLQMIEKELDSFAFGDLSFFNHIKSKWIDSLSSIPVTSETFGIVHGDPNPSNYFYSDPSGFSLFDFDHCAYGFKIHDLAVMKLCFSSETFTHILFGYESIRSLRKIEKVSITDYANILQIKKFRDIFNILEIRKMAVDERIIRNALETLASMAR